jgi:polyisoprenoid-binding protein YceI
MKKLYPILSLSAVLAIALTAHAKFSASGGDVQFIATGPGGLKITGTTHQVTVKDDGSNLVVIVPLSDLDTGIALRNKHMKEKYLETDKYPNAELVVAKSAVKADGAGTAQGTMKIHGKSKEVSVSYNAKKNGASIAIDGTTQLNMKEFGIEVPNYLGVTVKPEVDVNVKFNAQDN